MSLALFQDEPSPFAGSAHLMIPSLDPCIVEREFSKGEHPGFVIEEIDPDFLTIFGGQHAYTPAREVQLSRSRESWQDQVVIDRFGGPSLCRITVGTYRNLLEEFWPIARIRPHFYLACLLECRVYGTDHMVIAQMGPKGYLIHQHAYPSKGRFDPNAYFAVPK